LDSEDGCRLEQAEPSAWLYGKVDGKSETKRAEGHCHQQRKGTIVRRGEIGGWKRPHEPSMLDRGEQDRERTENNKSNANDIRDAWIDARVSHALRCEKIQKQAEPRDDKTKTHDGEPGTDPCQKRAFSGKENARI